MDVHSGGFVGMSVRDQEDSAAVSDAFDDGGVTTGEATPTLWNQAPQTILSLMEAPTTQVG